MWFQWVLLAALLAAMSISANQPRCLLWLFAGLASFCASKVALMAGIGGENLTTANAIFDGLVLLSIALMRQFIWERALFGLFVGMLVCHTAQRGHFLPDMFPEGWAVVGGEPLYASLLELLNLAAIVTIGTVSWEARRHGVSYPIGLDRRFRRARSYSSARGSGEWK